MIFNLDSYSNLHSFLREGSLNTNASKAGRYRLERQVIKGNRSGLLPSLWEASDESMYLYARTWTKKGESRDLRALWNHEIRSLLRLSSYPRASEYFVRLRDLGSDSRRYYVILDAGERVLLSSLLQERGRNRWLQEIASPSVRRRVWDGMTRVATALSILHAEGSIHRSLGPESIFTDSKGECDFRLSGFEWSLQISASPPVAGKAERSDAARLRAPELFGNDGRYSFATDWFDFGLLACEIFGLSVAGRTNKHLLKLREAIAEHSHLSLSERALLHDLLEADPDQRMAQSAAVLQGLAAASASVHNRNLAKGKPLYIGFNLGVGSRVSEAIYERTKQGVPIQPSDIPAQIGFLTRDLSSAPRITARSQPAPHYIVSGKLLDYHVTQWTGRQTEKTWDAGYCARIANPRTDPTDKSATLEDRVIAVRTMRQIGDNLKRIRSEGIAWDSACPFDKIVEPLDERQQSVFEFFHLSNQLDALLAAAQLWPVQVVSVQRSGDRIDLNVTPVSDPDRNALAQNLDLSPTDQQMKDFLTGDPTIRLSEDAEFSFSDVGFLSRKEEQTSAGRWRYRSCVQHPKGVKYLFSQEDIGLQLPSVGAKLYLTPRDLGGTVAQLYRRNQAIDALRSHAGLLDTISDPARTRRDTESGPDPKIAAAGLDDSKSDALAAILGTQPLYALQGPPGTGKTRLIASLASGLLAHDPAAQILITAHSHEAVRNARRALPRWLRDISELAERPIIIRTMKTTTTTLAGGRQNILDCSRKVS
ncbi:AAA domain-containing protein [Mesorhizobium sp. B2-3-10]|uniref:protein kinase domain-containing protein n=1 Tax=Mesorhizobium sp. B2-3-10 TaxID=2589954 RepID=UPI0011291C12|nr:AAA domain-containing protein [Mesorhizobium sp. B2-3-10]TPM02122.1 hypothetical protein FJ943_08515 [Mesorhizobium sp. B2-3-10]